MNWDEYCIWWTRWEDLEGLGEPLGSSDEVPDGDDEAGFLVGKPVQWPDYLWRQYRDRFGRAGRGRLWSEPGFPTRIPEDCSIYINSRCGGIVIRKEDVVAVACLPGYVTKSDMTFAVLSLELEGAE